MQVYLINLARRNDRLHRMSGQLGGLGLPFLRVEAVDARTAPDCEIIAQFDDAGPLGVIPRGDKCCTLSHMRAWQAFVQSGDSHGLVLEDDVALNADAAPILSQSDWIPRGVDLLKLERFGPPNQRVLLDEQMEVSAHHSIGRLRSRHTGAAAYILSRRSAKTLLERKEPWTLPVDHLLFNPNNSPLADILRPYQLTPAIAHQSEALGGRSDIEEWRTAYRRRDWSHVRRELVRAYFELRLLPSQIARWLRREASLIRVDNRVNDASRHPVRISAARPPRLPGLRTK